MLDTAAARTALARLQKIARPPEPDPHRLGAQLALLRCSELREWDRETPLPPDYPAAEQHEGYPHPEVNKPALLQAHPWLAGSAIEHHLRIENTRVEEE